VVVDGNDVLAVSEVAQKVVTRARQGFGPYFVELKTYRWRTHAEGMPEDRPSEEIESWKKRDPIAAFEKRLIEGEMATQMELQSINEKVMQEIAGAVKFGLESPIPRPEEALADVFAE
jgi:pyruvate dehydrogenase E1 component alpha subunit